MSSLFIHIRVFVPHSWTAFLPRHKRRAASGLKVWL
jgi:hypothetical protein